MSNNTKRADHSEADARHRALRLAVVQALRGRPDLGGADDPALRMRVEKYRTHRAGMEGGGYTAELHWGGKRRANLSNDGNGGGDRIDFSPSDGRMYGGENAAAFLRLVDSLPEMPMFGTMLKPSADSVVSVLIGDAKVRKLCAKSTVFETTDGRVMSMSGPPSAAALAYIAAKYPGAEVFNITLAGQRPEGAPAAGAGVRP